MLVRSTLILWLVCGSTAVLLALGAGCFEPSDTFVNYTRAVTVSAGTGGTGGNPNLTPREFFEENVKDQLIAHCSGSDCHSSGVRAFLLLGQEYASITTYRTSTGLPLIVDPPQDSQLIVYPDDDEHPGKSWDGIEDVREVVLQWLSMESVDDPPEFLLEIAPVNPEGFTVLQLGEVGADYAGYTITFYAIVYADSVLELTDISVWPPNNRGLKMVDPTFVIDPPGGGEPILDTSHHGDYTFVAPNNVTLGSGDLLVTGWSSEHRIGIRFASLQALFADDDGNTFVPCTRDDLFRQAVDALPIQASPTANNGLLYCASQCHGGSAGAEPTNVMNIAALLSDPRDYELACAKTRAFITPTQPDQSLIVTVTDPASGVGMHPFIFGGNAGSHTEFRDTMAPWIDAEGN